MKTKFAIAILIAAIAVLASGLTIISTQKAAALVATQPPNTGGINLSLGPLSINLGQAFGVSI